VFCIKEDLGDAILEVPNGLVDNFKVLVQRDVKSFQWVNVPRLAKNRYDLSLSFNQGLEIRIFLGGDPCATGTSKGNYFCLGERDGLDLVKKLDIPRVGTGPSSFDVMDTQFIQLPNNPNLVLYREGNVLSLGTIPEGGIVDLEGIGGVQENIT